MPWPPTPGAWITGSDVHLPYPWICRDRTRQRMLTAPVTHDQNAQVSHGVTLPTARQWLRRAERRRHTHERPRQVCGPTPRQVAPRPLARLPSVYDAATTREDGSFQIRTKVSPATITSLGPYPRSRRPQSRRNGAPNAPAQTAPPTHASTTASLAPRSRLLHNRHSRRDRALSDLPRPPPVAPAAVASVSAPGLVPDCVSRLPRRRR